MMRPIPSLGIGIGLRPAHYEEILSKNPEIDWFEIISENFLSTAPYPQKILEQLLERYPVVQHGVSLAIGSPDPLDFDYLTRLKALSKITKTPWISDHLSWGRLDGAHFHDLLPLPYRKEVADYVAERARIVQDFLEIPFALENLSSYATFHQDEMPEWEFYRRVIEKADIHMMLDVNNIYVSSRNAGFDPKEYLEAIPYERVVQIHVAGHRDRGTHCIDTHDNYVIDDVWELYSQVWPKTQKASTLLEWDDNFISLQETCQEAQKARVYQEASLVACR